MRFKSLALVVLLCASQREFLAQSPASLASTSNTLVIDASQPEPVPEAGFLHLGGTSSSGNKLGHLLEVNSRYLTLDDKPILPVMGEFHYSRYPAQYWEEEILKMKAAGVNIISTYVFWIHQEEIEGQFDWSGQRDLRRFVQLCAKHGMFVYLRPGPWDHGEARNGGLPDWLANQPGIRSNDPAYLAHVARLDGEIGEQVKGLLWKDGGPIIGLQLENEYSLHGPGMGSDHILKLKELAIAAGLDVPLYSVTGWPSLDFPPHEVIPVSGGYPDGFWFGSLTDLPPSMNYLFNLNRKLGDMGATVPSEDPTGKVDLKHDPYFGAEEAGGMASAYHRRPLLEADDVAALMLTGVGSGLNLYGFYMYHGGQNPHGKLTTLQESQATGYPNDLPEYGYDFQAPLGEYGQERDSYRKTRELDLFLNSFGPELAQMAAVGPAIAPKDAGDTSVARVSLRSKGGSGFLFVNNYVRQTEMPERVGFQAKLKLPDTELVVPDSPTTVPANTYFCWPVNLDISGVTLRYSTAQLLTKIETKQGTTFVFFAIPGIAPVFSLAADSVKSVKAPGANVGRVGSSTRIEGLAPGPGSFVDLVSTSGKVLRILLLSSDEAQTASVVRVQGGEHLLLSRAATFADGATLHVRSAVVYELGFRIYPAVRGESVKNATMSVSDAAGWATFRFERPEAKISWTWTKVANAKPVPPVAMGPFIDWRRGKVATVPSESAFDAAGEWRIDLKQPPPAGVSDLWLNLDYVGDIGRLFLGNTLVDDHFFDGHRWQIGLKRYLPEALSTGMKVQILPLRRDAPIYLDPRIRPDFGGRVQLDEVHATVTPEYEVLVDLRN